MVKIVKWNFLWTAQEYESVALQLTGYISPDKVLFFSRKLLIFFLFLHKKICCGIHLKCLAEALQMNTNNICFHGKIRKIFSQYPFLSGAMHSLSKIKQ